MRMSKIAFALAAILAASIVTAADAPGTELQDRAAIQNLIVKYAIALDSLDADMFVLADALGFFERSI